MNVGCDTLRPLLFWSFLRATRPLRLSFCAVTDGCWCAVVPNFVVVVNPVVYVASAVAAAADDDDLYDVDVDKHGVESDPRPVVVSAVAIRFVLTPSSVLYFPAETKAGFNRLMFVGSSVGAVAALCLTLEDG